MNKTALHKVLSKEAEKFLQKRDKSPVGNTERHYAILAMKIREANLDLEFGDLSLLYVLRQYANKSGQDSKFAEVRPCVFDLREYVT